MWIDSNFLYKLNKTLEEIVDGENVDIKQRFQNYDSKKYNETIKILKKLNKKVVNDAIFLNKISTKIEALSKGDFSKLENISNDKLSKLFSNLSNILNKLIIDSNKMNNEAKKGHLDIRIDESQYYGDFAKIIHGINETMQHTFLALKDVGNTLNRLSNEDLTAKIESNYEGDYELLKIATNNLAKTLNENKQIVENQNWLQNGLVKLNEKLSGENTILEISHNAITFLGNYLNAGAGAFYVYDEKKHILIQNGSYAFVQREELSNIFKLGEGVVGQVALQKSPIHLKNIHRSDFIIKTGTTSEPPLNTYTFPLIFNDKLYGVIEIASSEMFSETETEFFTKASEIIATALFSSIQHEKVEKLLEETNKKNMEIEKANAELEEQQQQLEEANSQMEEQQQQLEEANSQMEEQQYILQEKNKLLEESEKELERKAKELEMTGKYKSEFLANMSHELRTPLNSIILLSELLMENRENHLNEEEIKKATIIKNNGNELLRLINDVLDLSKVESGKMELIIDDFDSTTLCQEFKDNFEYFAIDRGLELKIIDEYKGPISTDKDKLFQIIKNLTSNAIKFTKEGSITLKITKVDSKHIKISIIDTGIGIAEDKQKAVFEAFQQAEGGTSREYGGTGLGLSISTKFVELMNGTLKLKSELGKGTEFSIIIPISIMVKDYKNEKNEKKEIPKPQPQQIKETPKISETKKPTIRKSYGKVTDDRNILTLVDKPYLIIEDDEDFATILKHKINEKKEYVLIATTGTEGLELVKKYDIKGILLDLGLPDIDGIDVLKELKTNNAFRKIPIYVISGTDKEKISKDSGAIGYTQKPIDSNGISSVLNSIDIFNNKKVKDLLIVESKKSKRDEIIKLIGNSNIKSFGVDSIESAKSELAKNIYDGIIIDVTDDVKIGLSIFDFMRKNNIKIPSIIYTESDLSPDDERRLKKYANSIVKNRDGRNEKLVDEVDIFMHRIRNISKENKVSTTTETTGLKNRKILIVDDDIRNIYVLSEAINSRDAIAITANNGKEAIDVLEKNSDIDLILMDIMMPEMDGYEATKKIKLNEKTKHIPIIALTAKRMDEDRQKVLDAGCDDYTTKPIKIDVLVSLLEGWLNK